MSIQRGEVELHGTLEFPQAGGPVPAVLLVQGSAAFDRSSLGLFDTLAHRLADIGFASLRVDDRGTGRSGGVKHDLSAQELAEDTKALHSYLSSRREVDGGRVGLLGHSFGGALVPVVAAEGRGVAFLILLAGYAVTGEQLMMESRRLAEERRNTAAPRIERLLSFQRAIFDASRRGGPWDGVGAEHLRLRQEEYATLDESSRSRYRDLAAYVASTPDDMLISYARTPWYKSFLDLDPRPSLEVLRIPVLALFAGGDSSVPPERNIAPMRAALTGNRGGSIEVIPSANHFFRVSGSVSEGLFASISQWLADLPSQSAGGDGR
ncbi:MAG: alpha/beta hydrolase [Longimicrobiales bacterium]